MEVFHGTTECHLPWDHKVLPANRHKWTHPALTPASQAGTRFTDAGGMEGWVDLVQLLLTLPIVLFRVGIWSGEFEGRGSVGIESCKIMFPGALPTHLFRVDGKEWQWKWTFDEITEIGFARWHRCLCCKRWEFLGAQGRRIGVSWKL